MPMGERPKWTIIARDRFERTAALSCPDCSVITRIGSREITAVSDGTEVLVQHTACGHSLELPYDLQGDLQM